jgi:hypothetical protein
MVFNLGSWMSAQGLSLTRDTERTQGNTRGLRDHRPGPQHPGRALRRDYLLELVEDSYAGATASRPALHPGAGAALLKGA